MFGSKAPPEVYAPSHHADPYGNMPNYGYPPHGQPPHHGQTTTYGPVTHQPSSQASNSVVLNVGNVGNNNNNPNKSNSRPWTTDLCGCFQDIQGCLCAWCLTPCFIAQIAMRLGECFCMPFCVPQSLMAMRIAVRERHKIQGSICEDCLCTCCCPMLSMCQLKRELDNIDLRKPGTL